MNNDINYLNARIQMLEDVIQFEDLTPNKEFNYRQNLEKLRLKKEYLENKNNKHKYDSYALLKELEKEHQLEKLDTLKYLCFIFIISAMIIVIMSL